MATRHQVVFFGTTNELSRAAFDALTGGDVDVLAVFVSAKVIAEPLAGPLERLFPATNPGDLPVVNPYYERTLLHAVWSAGIPVYSVAHAGSHELVDLLDSLCPSAACVACFPAKLPIDLISRMPLGFLNVHPSLLPHYRGPAPLFWLFQKGDADKRGVSVHLMDAKLDTGPLVAQESLEFADGLDQIMIERICGALGGRLLLQALSWLASGRTGRPQPDSGSYHPWPSAADYALETSWSARRAFNFMRATNGDGITYNVSIAGRNLALSGALQFTAQGLLSAPVDIDGLTAHLQFNPGTLSARLSLLS
jgi:methionyl-tRNA formyltransferase